MPAGTMIKLAASEGDIDTTQQLTCFSAYQKVCVVNGTNLKIADFSAVKLTHSALTVPHAPGTVLIQGSGANYAKMTVTNTNPTKTATYGLASYYGSVSSFSAGPIDSATGDGAGDLFTIATAVDPPHWYDWTPDPDGVVGGLPRSYGSLPESANIGCLYLGRAMLGGNPDEPFQWYMSRQGNIFDWGYFSNDDQSAVSADQGNLGGPGDILIATAQYKDDYVVLGCATSMYVIFGDPMTGGQLRELDLTTGIFGDKSFCWDAQNNFYWWGTNGIYRTAIPGTPQCITQIRLPDLINDENAGPTTHRITMAFDNRRNGINVCVTTIATGINSNYWYPLASVSEDGIGGFFPEEYPYQCGAYSQLYYDSTTIANRGLLIGCNDGYIRKFDESKYNDDVGASDEAIDSYVTIGPLALGELPNREGKLSGLDFTLADTAGASDVLFKVFADRTAGKVIQQLEAGTLPKVAGTIKGPGQFRGSTIRQPVLGAFAGIRIENSTAGETWAFENLTAHISQSGRIK
jgi:hypothetical protein